MKTVVAVLAVVAMVAEAYIPMGPPVGSGVRGRVGGRVVGGRPATATEAPWQISLNSQGLFGKSHICGGSLRDPNYVITAAHCCDGSSASSLFVHLGGLDRTKLAQQINVAAVEKHGQYSSSTIDYDYCLLKLAKAATTGNGVSTIPLATVSPADGAAAQLTGWGKTSGSTSALPTALQYADFTIVSQSRCNGKWSDVNTVTPRMICAENKAASGCNGDSGGPLVSGGKLVGIVSWGANGCPPDTTVRPTVYADVANQNAWLSRNI
jgi:trypsin